MSLHTATTVTATPLVMAPAGGSRRLVGPMIAAALVAAGVVAGLALLNSGPGTGGIGDNPSLTEPGYKSGQFGDAAQRNAKIEKLGGRSLP